MGSSAEPGQRRVRSRTRPLHARLPRLLAASSFVVLCALAPAASASHSLGRQGGGPAYGVAEDATQFATDGGASIYPSLTQIGMTVNRWTVTYTGDPSVIADQGFLDVAVPAAQAAGVTVYMSLFPAMSGTPDPTSFCEWVGSVASRYPSVTHFIIGNEVNTTRFWSPQHTASDPEAGPRSYEAVLATCYDVLKGINPAIQVIGMGLSPRSVSSHSTAPLVFIRDVGAVYRASGRTAPLMDAIAVHPYPNPNAKPPPAPLRAAYENPGFFGIPQMSRVKQAVYDAFNGTPQPTTLNGLSIVVDEVGYQTSEISGTHGYTGIENSPVVSESAQALYYAQIVQLYACDPSVSAVLFFHLIDETNLNTDPTSGGWQSGLERPDGSQKPSYASVQHAIAAGCSGPLASWSAA
jgi:hypothetical protein